MRHKRQHRRLYLSQKPSASRTVAFRAEDEAQTRDPQLGRLMLYQLSYFRKNTAPRFLFRFRRFRHPVVFAKIYRIGVCSFCPTAPWPLREIRNSNRFIEWEVMDSNHRRRKPADLQSAPFDRSGNFPYFPPLREAVVPPTETTSVALSALAGLSSSRIGFRSRWRDSNPRPADYKSAALAN